MIWLDDLVAVVAKYLVILGAAYFVAHIIVWAIGV